MRTTELCAFLVSLGLLAVTGCRPERETSTPLASSSSTVVTMPLTTIDANGDCLQFVHTPFSNQQVYPVGVKQIACPHLVERTDGK